MTWVNTSLSVQKNTLHKSRFAENDDQAWCFNKILEKRRSFEKSIFYNYFSDRYNQQHMGKGARKTIYFLHTNNKYVDI